MNPTEGKSLLTWDIRKSVRKYSQRGVLQYMNITPKTIKIFRDDRVETGNCDRKNAGPGRSC